MIIYRDHYIDSEVDHHGQERITIQNPEGDCWYATGCPRDEVDSLLDETETLSQTLEREAEWKRR